MESLRNKRRREWNLEYPQKTEEQLESKIHVIEAILYTGIDCFVPLAKRVGGFRKSFADIANELTGMFLGVIECTSKKANRQRMTICKAA